MSNTDFNPDESADFTGTSTSGAQPTDVGATTAPATGATGAPVPFSQQWTKLGIINEALVNTANNQVVLPDDQATPEWIVGSRVYDQWLGLLIGRRDWSFATKIVGAFYVGASPFPGYADIFAKPPDCMQLKNCWRGDLASLILPATFGMPSEQYDTLPPPLDYDLIGDQIHTTVTDQSGPPQPGQPWVEGDLNEDFNLDFSTAAALYCEYIPFPTQAMPFSIGFIAALRLKVECGLFRALNEDFSEANRADKEAEAALQEAASRVDAQTPRKVAFRSPLIERRRRGRFSGFYGGGW